VTAVYGHAERPLTCRKQHCLFPLVFSGAPRHFHGRCRCGWEGTAQIYRYIAHNDYVTHREDSRWMHPLSGGNSGDIVLG
jgi:hypothetical protein